MSVSRSPAAAALVVATALGCASSAPGGLNEALRQEVFQTERAFAKTMADRDHAAFVSFLAEETVFFSGETPLRGAAAVGARWKRYYEGPAPFSWEPEQVEVLDSGTLALSTGPVRDPEGKPLGTFTSIWRREGPGKWRIVFDKGNPACPKTP
jgi:ketosteroid isomerase-like protein